jgi:hypothetical protein
VLKHTWEDHPVHLPETQPPNFAITYIDYNSRVLEERRLTIYNDLQVFQTISRRKEIRISQMEQVLIRLSEIKN